VRVAHDAGALAEVGFFVLFELWEGAEISQVGVEWALKEGELGKREPEDRGEGK
jgi:hypothetical protein